MKKTIIAVLMILCGSAFAFAQNRADLNYIDKNIPVAEFDAIECNLPCDVEYTMGNPNFQIYVPAKVEEHLIVTVKDRKLIITLDKTKLYKFGSIKVKVSSPTLKSVELNGAVEFDAPKGIGTEEFVAKLNGASELDIDGLTATDVKITANGTADIDIENLNCDDIAVTVNGAGECELSGVCVAADLTVNGVGTIKAYELKAKTVNSAVNGVGSIKRK